ncbi:anthranilate phosphoribosyltransferase [Paenibacillus physcomitrellae]|uniref:Anthranilate phosphoribosyltransferase n=1 Tax=Paenibacillus physcomitrellae TaxID=1619311 RepID=A0ABQ1G6F9_9BACL|nr:anthranilate phosphoribosyltransferase [Paenibacillus physcomitrellae]GGA37708.1 anthranilate phosphoribosyltransferase [Paenibacillus physcomitrellae]
MINHLKEVARGKRGARDLSYEDAFHAAEAILNADSTPAQTGAFLAAERIKLESLPELEAFVHACRKHARREAVFPENLDCAGPYDGRKSSFVSTFPAAFVLSAAGLPVTLHGTAPLPPKWGVTLQDILAAAGIHADRLSPEAFITAARLSGVLYANADKWSPMLASLRPIREELDMRTIFNTAEKLVDYGTSPYLTFGIYHNTVFDRISRLVIKLGYKSALIIQGQEGSDDLFIDRATRIYAAGNGTSTMDVIDPEAMGLDTPVPELEWSASLQLQTAEEVLQGGGHMAFYNQTLLNAAVRLQIAGKAGSIEEGLYICKSLLDSGEAWRTYNDWKGSLLACAGSASGSR